MSYGKQSKGRKNAPGTFRNLAFFFSIDVILKEHLVSSLGYDKAVLDLHFNPEFTIRDPIKLKID